MICPTCGASPCINPSFCKLCRDADRKVRGERSIIKNRPTPPVEAVILAVRDRGLAALKEPANVERLERCDAAAKAEIERRIAKLRKD